MPTYERMIVFRLGRIRTPQGPGMVLLLPFIDSFQRVDLRTRAFNVPPCKVRGFSAALTEELGACPECTMVPGPWPVSHHLRGEGGRRDQKIDGGWEDILASYT